MNSETLYLVLSCLALVGLVFLLVTTLWNGAGQRLQSYLTWLESSLEHMFLPKVAARMRVIVCCTAVAAALLGGAVPVQFKVFDTYALNRAIKLNSKGDYLGALDALGSYRDSVSPLAYNEIGVSYLGLNTPKQAVIVLEKAVELNPDYFQAHLNLAQAYALLGKETDAAFERRKARSLRASSFKTGDFYKVSEGGHKLMMICVLFTIFGVAGFLLPGLVVYIMWQMRIKKFDNQLPEGLVMATNGLRAGLSFGQVIDQLANEAPTPLNEEFSLISREVRLGRSLDEALQDLTKRMPTDETVILVNSVTILREYGGNLAEVFENLAETIRERKLLKQKISAMTAEGKMQAIILLLLPVVLGFVLSKLSPKEFDLLFNTPMGLMIMVFMVVWGGVGSYFMWKTIQVKI